MVNKKQILIVEDETIIAMNIRNLLENLGYEICGLASSAEEAVKLAEEKHPDLILIDIILDGEIDGIDAVIEIKQTQNMPIIYMTAHSDEKTLARAKATEPHGYILKPVNFNELRSTIEIVLHKYDMEEKLKKSEEMWQFAIEGSGDGVWDWDIANMRVTYSRRWKEILGYEEDEIKDEYSEWEKRIHKDDRDETLSAIKDNLDGKSGYFRFEYRLICKDGDYKWVLGRGKVISRDRKNNPLRMIGTLTDISRRKKTEEALVEEKYFTDAAINTQLDTFLVFDIKTGKPLRWNDEFRRASGYTDEEIIDVYAPEFFFGKEDLKRTEEAIRTILDNGSVTIEMELQTKSGKKVPFEYNSTLVRDSHGKPHVICFVGREITERLMFEESLIKKNSDLESANKELKAALEELEAMNEKLISTQNELMDSEKKYQNIFNMMIDGFSLYEIIREKKGEPVDFRFLEINPAFEKLTGLTRDIIGKTIKEVLPDIEDYWIKTFEKVVHSGESVRFENYAAPFKKWFEISAYCPNENQIACIFVDSPDRKKSEK